MYPYWLVVSVSKLNAQMTRALAIQPEFTSSSSMLPPMCAMSTLCGIPNNIKMALFIRVSCIRVCVVVFSDNMQGMQIQYHKSNK